MKPFQAIIFDMDGVIVDSEPRHALAFDQVFADLGYANTHGLDYESYYGKTDRILWDDFIAKHHPPQPIEELIRLKQTRYLELLRRDQPVFPAAVVLLEKLSRRYRLALASGSMHIAIDEVLKMQNLRRFFPVVVSVQDVARSKPAPDVFLRAAERLGVAPTTCCVIEDAPAGIEAARAAGMSVIAIANTLPAEKLSRATHVVRTYAEIEPLLLNAPA